MPELLIAGGLTIDRFPDGRTAPGGSVIHSGRAAVGEGVRPTIVTVAGNEPEAADGLRALRVMADVIHQPAATTTTYRHDEAGGRRVLIYDAATDPIVPATAAGLDDLDVALFAPIGHELPAATVVALHAALKPRRAVFLIQGWLRRLAVGEPVHPLPLDEVAADVWDAFSAADAIVVSTEDLAEIPEDPFRQAAAVRERVGDRPLLVLTLGPQGYLLDDPTVDRVVAWVPRRVVENVPMVGAGDTFGVVLALRLAAGADPAAAAAGGSDAVIRMLESRR